VTARSGGDAAPATHELTAPNDAPRLDVLVAEHLDISRNQAATLIANGRVLVDGRREKASYRARAGERVSVTVPPPPSRAVTAENIPLSIVYEDEDVLVVDKGLYELVMVEEGEYGSTLLARCAAE